MSKRSNHTVTVVGVGVVLLALGIVLSAVFAPRMEAKRALRGCRGALADTETFSYVSVYNPLDRSGPLLPTDTEVRMTDTAEIDAVRDRILTFADGAKYRGVEEAISGNWDIRVRFADGSETADLYLGEDSFYLSRDERRFVFAPRDVEAYITWRTEWLNSLFGTAE